MNGTAKFVRIMKEWKAPAILFNVDPPLKKKKQIVVAAANAGNYYSMFVYLVGDLKKKKWYIHLDHDFLHSNLPDFRGALKQLGYTMIGDVPRKPRRKK